MKSMFFKIFSVICLFIAIFCSVGLFKNIERHKENVKEIHQIEASRKREIIVLNKLQVEAPAENTYDEVEIEIEETKKETEETVEAEISFESLGEFKLTAYCSCEKCCGVWALNRPKDEFGNEIVYGASGQILVPEYSVAVDPTVIPYGTKIYIGEKEYIAHDCGGAIKGNRIDVYFNNHQDAWNFGVQMGEVFVINE